MARRITILRCLILLRSVITLLTERLLHLAIAATTGLQLTAIRARCRFDSDAIPSFCFACSGILRRLTGRHHCALHDAIATRITLLAIARNPVPAAYNILQLTGNGAIGIRLTVARSGITFFIQLTDAITAEIERIRG